MNSNKTTKSAGRGFLLFEPLILVVFWVLLFASPFLMGNFDTEIKWGQVFRVWLSFVPFMFIFLVNRFALLPYLFFKRRHFLYVLSIVALIACTTFVVNDWVRQPNDRAPGAGFMPAGIAEGHRPPGPPAGRERHMAEMPPPRQLPPYITFVLISILVVGFDTGLRLSVKWVQSEQKRAIEQKEHIETQLAFLRNQVSPHFFMNTLNNIHALIDYDSGEAKESIIRLSRLMRHLLYESESEKILIKKEMNFISDYVDLMRLRYSEKINITLRLPQDLPDKTIPPLLFTSFVENAFKHGVSYRQQSEISITVQCTEKELLFSVRNYYDRDAGQSGNGIGMANAKKRLDLLFGDQYDLNISTLANEYIVTLSVPL